jgi:urease accessory protein
LSSATSALLLADPAFAAGAGSFSSGLETLASDGLVTGLDDLVEVMVGAIRGRWNTFDRVFLNRALAALDDDARLEIDWEIEASTAGKAARDASRRAGSALLGTWARLGNEAAARYRRLLTGAPHAGHLVVAQAIVFAERELPLTDAEALACWATLSSYASGAVRLGIVGHRSAQQALLAAEEAVRPLLSIPVDASAEPHAFAPLHDIALERHSLAELTLFAS